MPRFKSRRYLYKNPELYPSHAFLHHEIADRIVAYIEDYPQTPTSILNIGAVDEYLNQRLNQQYPRTNIYALNESDNTKYAADLVVSNLYLQDAPDIEALISVFWSNLNPNGALIFSTLATESLPELILDEGIQMNPYPDIKELGNYLHSIGFVNTMMHIEKINLTYARLDTLLNDLRITGAKAFHQPFKGLRTQKWLDRWRQHMEQFFDGTHYHISLDVLYGQATAPPLKNTKADDKGEAYFDIKQIKKL